mgnify:CR=1 FL=1
MSGLMQNSMLQKLFKVYYIPLLKHQMETVRFLSDVVMRELGIILSEGEIF